MRNSLVIPATAGISGSISLPGSKSYTNRYLVMAALASGESILRNASLSDDSLTLIAALSKLGVVIERENTTLCVHGTSGNLTPYSGELNVGPAGTTLRFLTSLCALTDNTDITLVGSDRMHARPISELVSALSIHGASIEYLGTHGCPPIKIRGKSPRAACELEMNGAVSSQFFSSLLLSAPLYCHGLKVNVIDELISKPYIDMTLAGMKEFGLNCLRQAYATFEIEEQPNYSSGNFSIEGDASGASYFWGLAALSAGIVRVYNISTSSVQGDAQFPFLMERMGCKVSFSDSSTSDEAGDWIEVQGTDSLVGITADMSHMPDTAQTLAVVAAAAQGETTLTGLQSLKHKETDRLLALQNELSKLGVKSDISEDSITIFGRGAALREELSRTSLDLHTLINTYKDHRMAMSFAMLGAAFGGVAIEDPQVVTKSFPEFWDGLRLLGIGVE